MDSLKIANRLKVLRESRGITQEEVAKAVGTVQTAVANYENGRRIPTDDLKQKIADFFGVSIQELFYE